MFTITSHKLSFQHQQCLNGNITRKVWLMKMFLGISDTYIPHTAVSTDVPCIMWTVKHGYEMIIGHVLCRRRETKTKICLTTSSCAWYISHYVDTPVICPEEQLPCWQNLSITGMTMFWQWSKHAISRTYCYHYLILGHLKKLRPEHNKRELKNTINKCILKYVFNFVSH